MSIRPKRPTKPRSDQSRNLKPKLSHLFSQQHTSHEFTLFEYCISLMNCGILCTIFRDEMSQYPNNDEYDALMHLKPMFEDRSQYFGAEHATRLYKRSHDRNQFIIKQISFLISQFAVTFSYRRNKNYTSSQDTHTVIHTSFSNNLSNLLRECAPLFNIDSILNIIVNQYIGSIQWLKPAAFARTQLGDDTIQDDFKYPLEFENNNTIFRYPVEVMDGIYIPANFCIDLQLDTDALYIFHIHMISKGDEIHIGLVSKDSYQTEYSYYFRRTSELVCYYGGREVHIENHDEETMLTDWDCKFGSIQGFAEVIKPKIESYRSGDFVSIVIYCCEKEDVYAVVFFKNGKAVADPINIEQLKSCGELILFGNVDYDNDAMYIEQSLYSQQLQL